MKIAWHGVYNPYMGYGSSNLELMDALESRGHEIYRVNLDDKAEQCEIGIVYSTAGQGALEMLPTSYRILYTMFECDEWPSTWVSACNCANQILVPSLFCKESLVKSGCDAPVRVIPLGINPEKYYPEERKKNKSFTFGYLGSGTMRKGYDLLLRAFLEEFDNKENVKLKIHSSNIASSTIVKDARIEYTCCEYTTVQQRKWYNMIDLFVMPSRGEGLGLTPLEAMACGTPIAVTDWGGSSDYLNENTLKIAIDGLESCNGYHGSNGNWARPSLESIKYCMRWAFEHQEEITDMGEKSAVYVKDNWNYNITAAMIEKILNDADTSEKIDIDVIDVLVWHGNPRNIRTLVGGFTRGEPRELTPKMASIIDPNDKRFCRERRYRRNPQSGENAP